MKKKNILNRAMFRQVKSPAYGTGISSNLVSDDQRQRYNYGGRVGFYTDYRGGPVFMGQMGDPIKEYWDASMGPIIQSGERGSIWDPDANEGEGGYTQGEGIYKVKGAEYGDDEKMDYIPTTYDEMKELSGTGRGRIPDIKNIDEAYMKDQAGFKRDQLERSMGYDIGTPVEGGGKSYGVVQPNKDNADRIFEEGTNWRENIKIPGADVTIDDSEKEITDMPDPHLRRETIFPTENTEDIGTEPTGWETLMGELDKSAKEKKRLGKGNALMQAAAAAVEWSGAGTAKERSAAISKGLTKVGDTAMKAAAEGMDLKDRVKILKAIEDVKGGHKMDVWDAKLKEYYGPSMTIAKATLKIKQDTLKKLEAGEDPKAIYDEFLGNENTLHIPQLKANKLYILTDKKVPVATDDKQEAIYKKPENDGIVFIDKTNNVVRYVDGVKQSVNEKTDKYFTWKQP